MPRRIFIGDIQGCRVELELLLESLAFDPAADELLPVGDLVNRGPDSLGCLRLLHSLGAKSVLGNHDLHLLRCAAGQRELRPSDTFQDVLAAPDREQLLAWLAALPFARVFDDVFCVHAGLDPSWSDPAGELARQRPLQPSPASDFATRVRYCTRAGQRAEQDDSDPGPPYQPWYEHFAFERRPPSSLGARRIVYGHWATRGLLDLPATLGLDSGCVWGRALSAWIPEEQRLISVPAERAWAQIGAD